MSLDRFAAIRHRFEGLASDDEADRLEASCAILSGLEAAPVADIQKALDRLLKGLSSGRKSARVGFSVTLTELLARILGPDARKARHHGINISGVLQSLQSYTVPEGKVPGQEERDNYLGRLFGLEAILKSGVLFRPTDVDGQVGQVLDVLLDLAKAKPWLREECGWILYQALSSDRDVADKGTFAQSTIERIRAKKFARSPEGLAIWLRVQSLYPNIPLPDRPWRHRDPLHPDNLTELSKVLKESPIRKEPSDADEEEDLQRGMWSSNPHFAWDVVFNELSHPRESSVTERVPFKHFWSAAVDESLFSASASKERKHWGFLLLLKAFDDIPRQSIPDLFTENLMRCLVNQLADGDRYLHRTALRVLKAIHSKVDEVPEMTSVMVEGLTRSGPPNFDQATKTKTVGTLVTQASEDEVERVACVLQRRLHTTGDRDSKTAEARRNALTGYLVSAVRGREILSDAPSWVLSILCTFATLGYSDTIPLQQEEEPRPPLSSATRTMFRARVSSCFVHLMSAQSPLNEIWPYRVLLSLQKAESSGQPNTIPTAIAERVHTAMKNLAKLDDIGKSSKKSRRAQIQAFKLLYSLVVFQIYDGFEDGLSVLSEIDHCFEKYFAEKNGATPDASSEVLVEVLLSLVSRTSALLRKLSHQVFTAFAREISKEGLQLLLDVLEAKESLAGQQSLFDQEENDDEDDSDESMAGGDQDADSDVEIISAEGTDDDDDQDTSEEGGAEQAGSPEDNDELARLNTALAQIVGTQPFDGDGPGDESDSLSAMSDTAMFALDDQMSRVFKERQKTSQTSKAQEKKTAKTTVLNLKNRVLDLLDIYVKTQHRSPRALRIILPLLRLIRTTGSKQIADRACGILRDFSQKCRGKDVTVLKPKKTKHAWEVLEQVHQEAMHDASRAHAAACSHGSLLVVKGLVAADNANVKRVVARYAATQTEWLQGFGKVQPGLFSDFLNWGVSCARQQQQQQQQQQQH